ncbi:quinon protein alcohol dehydrogenase-like superfamily [Schizophyllum commune]
MEAASKKACLPDTRVLLLETIMDWVFDPDGSRCFCLYGTAGQGKTAVAHSVARQLADMGVASPFFAFDRNNRERVASQLFPTIARSLAYVIQHQIEQLRKLRADQLETRDIPKQCERLFLSCLRDYLALTPIIIVIDALDECPNDNVDDQKDRESVLKAFIKCIATNGLHRNIRFFVTARLDPDIQTILSGNATLTRLYSIDAAAETRADIRRFVALELSDTKTAGYIDIVTDAAQTHFECAAVLCRELKNGGKPMSSDARNKLIERIESQPGRSLYETYQLILETHLDKTDAGCLSVYRQLLSWILTVRQPQSRAVFEEIVDLMLPREDVMGVLEGLGSLLTGTVANDQDPIRPLHTSFRDYVLDAEASGVFCITSEFDAADSQLALACFGIMGRPTNGLRYNICDLPSPFVYKEDVENLDGRLTEHVSPALHYACREISAHLSRCENRNEALALVSALKGFLRDRFLFWVEACGWLGYEPCDVLQDMLEWAKIHDSDNLAPLVSDFIAFEKRFRAAISMSPPQVYITGLLFAPVDSHVSRLYRACITSSIEISGYEQEREWPMGEALVIQAGSPVNSIAYSPDDTKIVAGLWDGTLRLWDARTGRQVGGAMRGHENTVLSAAVSPDGSRIASGSWDHTVRLWDAKTSQQRGEALRGHTNWVRSVAFAPDGATVVSGSDDYTLRLWDAQTGKGMGNALKGHTDSVNSVVFSHDGTRIISGAGDTTVRIWETATHRQLGDPIQHEDWVVSVAISRDGKYIASGCGDGTVRVWDVEGRQQVWALRGHKRWLFSVAVSPDSTRIVSGGSDSTVRIWEAASGKQVGDDLRGYYTNDVNSVAFSPDGKHVASGSSDSTIRVWVVREVKNDGGTPNGHTGHIFSVACSSDGKYIVSGSHDKTVRLWDAQTGQPVGDPMTGHDGDVICVMFSPDGSQIASASSDHTVRVWDVTTRQVVGDALEEHDDCVTCVAFSPDGTRLVSGSVDRTLRLWDLATGQQIGVALNGHEDRIRSVSFSSDGLCVASVSDDGTILLWGARSQLHILKGHQDYVASVAFSQNGVFLVSGSADGTIRIWDTHSGKQMGELLSDHSGYVLPVSFSHDGKYVLIGSNDLTVRVWNVQTMQPVGVALRGHERMVNSVAFSSDGTRIVSGSSDGTIRIWDFRSSQTLVDDASASVTRARLQSPLQENEDCWLVSDDNGTERPILWIPHHLQHIHRVYSPFHIQFVPPTTPQMHIRLNESFHLDKWPAYTPAPAAEESLEALGREE